MISAKGQALLQTFYTSQLNYLYFFKCHINCEMGREEVVRAITYTIAADAH